MKLNIENKYKALSFTWEEWEFTLKDLLSFSEKTILYFYPKDNTPGCTIENKDFSCLKGEYKKLWITLIWVSKDSLELHQKFINKHELKVDLISDPDLVLHKELWAFWEKNNYWKIVQWVIRSTFLVDSNGEVLKEWRNIKAAWHAERLLKELK